MSRSAAPVGDVTTPIRRGKRGSGRLRAGANSPSAASLALEALELALERAQARLFEVFDDELVLAAGLVHADAAAHQQLRPGARA